MTLLYRQIFPDFIDVLPEIVKDIESSAFISFDGEFTGLANERNIMPFDTSEEYYEKQLKASKGFILIQLGLTFFKSVKDDDGKEQIKLKSYNIYVYPQSRNATFSCQGSSLSFLAENGFDFNKLLSSGISYSNTTEEEKLRQEMKEKQAIRMEQLKAKLSTEEPDLTTRNFIPVPDNEKEFLNGAREKIQNVADGKVTETMFDKANPFQRKLIYELIEREFNNKVSTKMLTIENNRKAMIVEPKRSDEEEMLVEKNRQLEDEKYIVDTVGLRLLLKEISSSKKLVVGHNCLLDLMYLMTQCVEDLPTDYNDFKTLTHRVFPNIIDTKFVGSSEKFRDMFTSTVLKQLYDQLQKPPFHKVEFEFENPHVAYNLETPKEHEAGYDSFLTGYCFLVILKYLKVPLDDFQPNKCKELNPFLNRIALFRIQQPYIYVTGKEPAITRDHVFSIKFPTTWQTSDVQDHFKNYGPVHCAWVNNGSAFVSLYNRENASCVIKTIARPAEFEIQSLADHQQQEKRDLSRKRKKENSESSETSVSAANGSKPGRKKKRGKKTFAESDQW